jgi:hypothetical protein
MRQILAVIGAALLVQLLLPISVGSALPAQQPSSQREVGTGLSLLHECTDAVRLSDKAPNLGDLDVMSALSCARYLGGFVDGYVALAMQYQLKSKPACIPPVSTEQLTRIANKWLGEHPERLQEKEQDLVATAFAQAFPCK